MKSHEVVRQACKQKGCKAVAGGMKVSPGLVYKWSRAGADGRSEELNPLDRVWLLYLVTGDRRLIEWLCAHANGFFVANPPVKTRLLRKLPEVTVELFGLIGQFENEISQAEANKPISAEEVRHIRALWEGLKARGESFVSACERGVFRLGVLFWVTGVELQFSTAGMT